MKTYKNDGTLGVEVNTLIGDGTIINTLTNYDTVGGETRVPSQIIQGRDDKTGLGWSKIIVGGKLLPELFSISG
jgi:hypothetical protein